MGLIKHDVKELFLEQIIHVFLYFLVVDDYDIVLMHLREQIISFLESAFDNANLYALEELVDFVFPIVSKGDGTNDQRAGSVNNASMLSYLGLLFLFTLIEHDAQGLQCLAQTHVITKRAVQVVKAKLSHPIQAFFLVVSKFDTC